MQKSLKVENSPNPIIWHAVFPIADSKNVKKQLCLQNTKADQGGNKALLRALPTIKRCNVLPWWKTLSRVANSRARPNSWILLKPEETLEINGITSFGLLDKDNAQAFILSFSEISFAAKLY